MITGEVDCDAFRGGVENQPFEARESAGQGPRGFRAAQDAGAEIPVAAAGAALDEEAAGAADQRARRRDRPPHVPALVRPLGVVAVPGAEPELLEQADFVVEQELDPRQ